MRLKPFEFWGLCNRGMEGRWLCCSYCWCKLCRVVGFIEQFWLRIGPAESENCGWRKRRENEFDIQLKSR